MTAAGKKIAAARVRAKLTGKELADKAGVTAAWVRSVETGGIARPAPDKLRRVADVVGLDIRELLALTDQLGAAAVMEAATPADQSEVAAAIREQTAMFERVLNELTKAIKTLDEKGNARTRLVLAEVIRVEGALARQTPGEKPPRSTPPTQGRRQTIGAPKSKPSRPRERFEELAERTEEQRTL